MVLARISSVHRLNHFLFCLVPALGCSEKGHGSFAFRGRRALTLGIKRRAGDGFLTQISADADPTRNPIASGLRHCTPG